MTGATSEGRDESFDWSWGCVDLSCFLTRQGIGPRALLLPALSSTSTRDEMAPLQALLAERFETVAPDWPAFGTSDKLARIVLPNAITKAVLLARATGATPCLEPSA